MASDAVNADPGCTSPPRLAVPVRLRDWKYPTESFEDFTLITSRLRISERLNVEGLEKSTLKALAANGLYIPLFDGLDEIPGEARRAAIREIKDGAWNRFLLTSRPGYEAEDHFARSEQLFIREFTGHDAKHYVVRRRLTYVRNATESGNTLRQRIRADEVYQVFSENKAQLTKLLKRPLFAAAWYHHAARTGRSLETEAQLMEAVFERAMGKRGLDDKYGVDILDQSRMLIGAILLPFAVSDFASSFLRSKLLAVIRSGPAYQSEGEEKLARTLDIAETGGFLIRISPSCYQALKSPLSEYLVSCYLQWLRVRESTELETLLQHSTIRFIRERWREEGGRIGGEFGDVPDRLERQKLNNSPMPREEMTKVVTIESDWPQKDEQRERLRLAIDEILRRSQDGLSAPAIWRRLWAWVEPVTIRPAKARPLAWRSDPFNADAIKELNAVVSKLLSVNELPREHSIIAKNMKSFWKSQYRIVGKGPGQRYLRLG